MKTYGKTARAALAAMRQLALNHENQTLSGSGDISQTIHISQALVAKVLTQLSQAGLVNGTRGPNGGYSLARSPGEICVHDIVRIFDIITDNDDLCPMGPGWCGVKDPCPLHETIVKLRHKTDAALRETTLEVFTQKGC